LRAYFAGTADPVPQNTAGNFSISLEAARIHPELADRKKKATFADRKKKATFHVTPAPASPRTALPPAAPHTSTGALGRPPARLPQHTTPAASAEQPAAPDGGRACGLGVGAGQPVPLKGGGLLKRQMLKKEGGTAEALPAMWNPLSVHTERSKCCAGD